MAGYQNRLCRVCNAFTAFQGTPPDEVIRAECTECGNNTHHRPICDNWDGEWPDEPLIA